MHLFFLMGFCQEIDRKINSNETQKQAIEPLIDKLIQSAKKQIGVTVRYNPAYKKISYPGGDIPLEEGVCTDVIIRALRDLEIDLQKLMHEDMKKNWLKYPKLWGILRPDKNIDHRRVKNLIPFFQSLNCGFEKNDFLPGDIVVWDLGKGVLHIGILSDKKIESNYFVIHNIGSGVKEENILTNYKIIHVFRLNTTIIKKLKTM